MDKEINELFDELYLSDIGDSLWVLILLLLLFKGSDNKKTPTININIGDDKNV